MLITRSQLQPVRRQTPHGGKQMANLQETLQMWQPSNDVVVSRGTPSAAPLEANSAAC